MVRITGDSGKFGAGWQSADALSTCRPRIRRDAMLLGVLSAPARQLVQIVNAPEASLACHERPSKTAKLPIWPCDGGAVRRTESVSTGIDFETGNFRRINPRWPFGMPSPNSWIP